MNVAKILKNPDYFRTISNPNRLECLAAIRANPENIQFIDLSNPFLEDLQALAVSRKPECLQYIREQTDDVCIAAISYVADKPNVYVNDIIPFITNWSERVCLAVLSLNVSLFQQLPLQTREICLLAVTIDPNTLQYVHDQTYEICLAAIRIDAKALRHVREKTIELCTKAVEINGKALEYVTDQTPELCELAVTTTPSAIRFVNDQTTELCELAVTQDPTCIRYVRNQTFDLSWLAVSNNPGCLEYIREKTRALYNLACNINRHEQRSVYFPTLGEYLHDAPNDVLCTIALPAGKINSVPLMYFSRISQLRDYGTKDDFGSLIIKEPSQKVIEWAILNYNNTSKWYDASPKTEEFQILYVSSGTNKLKDIENPSEKVCLAAVVADPNNLKYSIQSEKIFLAAIESNADAIRDIPNQSEELCMISIQHHPNSLRYIQNQTLEMCRLAVSLDPLSFKWIKSDEHKISILRFGQRTKSAASMIID